MQCADCRSDDIRKVSLLYESGLSYIDTRSSGVGVGAGIGGVGVGVGRGRNRGTQTTALSMKLAPPQKCEYGKELVGAILCFMFAVSYWWLVIIGIALIVPVYQRIQWNRLRYPYELEMWRQRFMCQRCGWIGVPTVAVETYTHPKEIIEAAPQPALSNKTVRRVKRYNRP